MNDSLHCAAEPDMATAVELPPLQAGIICSSIDIADGDRIQQHDGPLPGPKDAAAAGVATVQPESTRLGAAAVARLRHTVFDWQNLIQNTPSSPPAIPNLQCVYQLIAMTYRVSCTFIAACVGTWLKPDLFWAITTPFQVCRGAMAAVCSGIGTGG